MSGVERGDGVSALAPPLADCGSRMPAPAVASLNTDQEQTA